MVGPSEYVSAEEAARLLGVSAKTIRRWIATGRLKAVKSGRSFRISVAELRQLDDRPILSHSDPNETLDRSAVTQVTDGSAGEVGQLARLVRELVAELVAATTTAATYRARAEALTTELARAEQRIRELQQREAPVR